jgi:hypothetical protein
LVDQQVVVEALLEFVDFLFTEELTTVSGSICCGQGARCILTRASGYLHESADICMWLVNRIVRWLVCNCLPWLGYIKQSVLPSDWVFMVTPVITVVSNKEAKQWGGILFTGGYFKMLGSVGRFWKNKWIFSDKYDLRKPRQLLFSVT